MTRQQDPAKVAQASRLYHSGGLSAREVAKVMEVDEKTVRRWLGNSLRRTGPRTDVTDDRLWRLRYEDKMTYDQIAAAVGLTRTPVRKRLARMARENYEASP